MLATIAGAAVGAGAGVAAAGENGETLGGVAGQALTPQVAVQAQRIIKKICKTLPLRLAGEY